MVLRMPFVVAGLLVCVSGLLPLMLLFLWGSLTIVFIEYRSASPPFFQFLVWILFLLPIVLDDYPGAINLGAAPAPLTFSGLAPMVVHHLENCKV